MSNQDFFISDITRRDRPIGVEPGDRTAVPSHHVRNIRSVFGSSLVADRPPINRPQTSPVADRPLTTIVVHTEHDGSTAIAIDEVKPRAVTAPATRAKSRRENRKGKAKSTKAEKVSRAPKTPARAMRQDSLASKVLASAAATMPTTAESGGASTLIDSGGAGALSNESNGQTLFRNLNSRVTFQVKIDHRKIGKFFKYLIAVSLIAASSYLAWDTWFTNKPISYIFSQAASAVSIDDTSPFSVDPTTVSNQAWTTHTAPADQPRYLYLPSINIKSRVDGVGINSNGNIDSPKNANDTAWYDGSAKPGHDGQVFINGHKSYSSSYGAAFDKLDQLKVDDQIIIENGNGDRFTYKVVSNQTLNTDKVDMSKALNVPGDAKQGITLMTYTGKYNYRDQSAEQRVVVYAVRL